MKFTYVLGCDMGKEHFNYCLVIRQGEQLGESSVPNEEEAIQRFLNGLKKQLLLEDFSACLLCMEHTGIYNNLLLRLWLAESGQLSIVPAQNISSMMAGDQGWDEKSDLLDARRIAEYCLRFSDKLAPYQLKTKSLQQLELLQRQRQRLVRALNILENPVNEAIDFMERENLELLTNHQAESIQALHSDLKSIEQELRKIIDQDDRLNQLFERVCSVVGVGPVTAREILIATQGFTKFLPTQAKSFARYAGVAPKEWSSGKSIRKRRATSKRANQKIKSLLTMGARSAAKTKGELGQYYRRKRAEGKPFLSVINALRNKIILRIFAVVRNQVMYQKKSTISLV